MRASGVYPQKVFDYISVILIVTGIAVPTTQPPTSKTCERVSCECAGALCRWRLGAGPGGATHTTGEAARGGAPALLVRCRFPARAFCAVNFRTALPPPPSSVGKGREGRGGGGVEKKASEGSADRSSPRGTAYEATVLHDNTRHKQETRLHQAPG